MLTETPYQVAKYDLTKKPGAFKEVQYKGKPLTSVLRERMKANTNSSGDKPVPLWTYLGGIVASSIYAEGKRIGADWGGAGPRMELTPGGTNSFSLEIQKSPFGGEEAVKAAETVAGQMGFTFESSNPDPA